MKTILGLLAFAAGALATSCKADNCARAVTGTRFSLSVQSAHKTDCASFMKVVVTPSPVTITITTTPLTTTMTTSTMITMTTSTTTTTEAAPKAKRAFDAEMDKRQVTVVPSVVPTYASACSGTSRYSSACSCFGYTVSTSTAPGPTVTVTGPPTGPQCGGANLLTDPKNCGKCGNVCSSGTCDNGVCTSPVCQGSVCGAYSNCGPGGECFCATTTEGAGFCMLNTPCDGLPTCDKDSDCGTDSVCAANTCCGTNVCLSTTDCAGQGATPAKRWFGLDERAWINGTTVNRGTWVD